MKGKSLFFAVLMIVSATVSLAGKDEPRKTGMAIVPVKGSEVFKVVYKGESAGKVKLTIVDDHAEIILSQVFYGTDGFICPLNFQGLASGEYTIIIADANGKQSEKIFLTRDEKPLSKKNVHVNKLSSADDKFLLSVSGPSLDGEKISVVIFDELDNVIYNETKKISGDFAKVYNVQTKSGAYRFEVSDATGKIKTVRF